MHILQVFGYLGPYELKLNTYGVCFTILHSNIIFGFSPIIVTFIREDIDKTVYKNEIFISSRDSLSKLQRRLVLRNRLG